MTRKKSNVKALALAVTCAILTGGGIGLEPVYAADVTYNTDSNKLQQGTAPADIDTLNVGNVSIHGTGELYGITIGDLNNIEHVMISNNDIVATGSVTSAIFADVGGARIQNGNVAAKKDLYVGYERYDSDNGTYENPKFAVNGTTGNVTTTGDIQGNDITAKGNLSVTGTSTFSGNTTFAKGISAANSRFTVDEYGNIKKASSITTYVNTLSTIGGVQFKNNNIDTSGAIKAESLTLGTDYNVKQNIEDAKNKINTVEGNVTTNQNNITTLTGRVDAHDTNIDELQKKTKGIARGTDDNSTTVEGVNFKEGAVSGVKSINNKLEFADDGIYLNKGNPKKQIKISDEGKIIIGTSSSAYDDDGFYAGGDDYAAAKAGMKSDGSLKAKGFAVDGTTGNTTVDGALTVAGAATFDGGITATGDVTTTGALKGKTLGIGTNGSEFTVDENGDTTVGGTLGVNGATTLDSTLTVADKTTLKNELQVNGKATFGDAAGSQTVINGDNVTTGRIETTTNQASKIGGVTLQSGKITADNMTITGTLDMDNLNVNETLNVGTFGVTKAGVVTGVTSINDVAVSKQGTGLKIGSATVGAANPFSSQGYTVDATGNVSAQDITAGKYNGNEITADKKFNGVELNGGNVKATNVTADTITGGNVTAQNIQADTGNIAGVNFATGGSVSGINELTAKIIKDGAGTTITGGNIESKTATIGAIKIVNETIESSAADGLSIENVKINNGAVSGVTSLTAISATIGGVNTLDNTGITVNPDKAITLGASIITNGKVKVSDKTSLTNEALVLNDTNKWTQEGGLVADKATVNGVVLGAEGAGKATFTDAEGSTTIAGKNITTGKIIADELWINKISLGKNGNNNISIDESGNVTTKGEIAIRDAAGNVMSKLSKDKATFGKDTANQTVIENGKLNAKAEDNNHQQAGLKFDENGFAVNGQTAEGKISAFGFNTNKGIGTFKGLDQTTTTVNGSVITSTNSATDTGVLNGSNLTLVNGDNKTELTAGGVTFTGKKGASAQEGNITTIDGGIITTDTLNVQRIELGEKLVDKNGDEFGSNLSMDNQGNFTAAGGNFKVTGGTEGSRGSITNVVGDDTNGKTSFETNQQGAKMRFKKGEVTSNVSVADGSANVSAGAGSIDVTNESITSKVTDNATSTITKDSIVDKVGNNSVTTDDKGTTFANGGTKTTNINGGTITTGKLITDELVITGKGDAAGPGTGSLAFGGNGTIKSDVKEDGSTNNTQFTTDINGVNTMVTDGKITATTTENKVTAEGNSNTVTKGEDQKSEFNQGLTSIGGVVTNGKIKVAQKLDGEHGLLTNKVTDADADGNVRWSNLEQSSTGLTYTDSAKPDNATRIDSGDVSIGAALDKDGNQLVDDGKEGINRINLSDLGQIDNLDDELKNRPEYKNGEEVGTAVGAINAEAGIRREEVARLDNRIDDVNNRVDKVGAMAAAIASLKSIGYDPQAPSEFSIGLGQYKGETGVAMGFFHYPNKNFMINVSLSTAGGETMGGIGATWRFGHKSPQKLLEEQREAQAKKELAAAEKYQAAAKLAKEAQERAEYAAKLARQAQVSADNAKAAADATQAKHFG